MTFHKAVKYGALLRLALSGPAGAGKTYTALTLATALADGGTVALIDTEHGSASKYADIFPEFDTLQLETFHPQKYIDAIHEAEAAGYAVLVIDSLSHAWSGQGGLLEEKDKIARAKYSGNSFSAWNDASAIQNKLVNVILGAKLHIIATVRSKMDYVLETGANGKTMPRKVGMAPVQRDDLPYEFDVFCTLESDNTLIVDKSRCPALSGAVIAKPNGAVADTLKVWLSGEPTPEPIQEDSPTMATEQQLASIRKLCEYLGKAAPAEDFSFEQARSLLEELTGEYRKQQEAKKAAPAMATSASTKPAQARQESAQGAEQTATNRGKINKLLREYKALRPDECKGDSWYWPVLRQAFFDGGQGVMPNEYKDEHVDKLREHIQSVRRTIEEAKGKQAAQTPV